MWNVEQVKIVIENGVLKYCYFFRSLCFKSLVIKISFTMRCADGIGGSGWGSSYAIPQRLGIHCKMICLFLDLGLWGNLP